MHTRELERKTLLDDYSTTWHTYSRYLWILRYEHSVHALRFAVTFMANKQQPCCSEPSFEAEETLSLIPTLVVASCVYLWDLPNNTLSPTSPPACERWITHPCKKKLLSYLCMHTDYLLRSSDLMYGYDSKKIIGKAPWSKTHATEQAIPVSNRPYLFWTGHPCFKQTSR